MTGKWMGRLSLAFNNAREHFDDANGVYDTNGNPTPTITEPLVDGGAFAPQSSGNGQGAIYMNARWQFNANGVYIAPYGIELAANVFGRQGYPMPLFRPGSTAALGSDSTLNVLVSPTIDYIRYDNVWDTDLRVARDFKFGAVRDIRLPRGTQALPPGATPVRGVMFAKRLPKLFETRVYV